MDKSRLLYISNFRSMNRFVTRLVLLIVIPVLLGVLLCEYFLRKVPNDYSYKNEWLTTNAASISAFCLGSSHSFYGIEPSLFSCKAFNASHVSQTLKYDHFIFSKFIDQMDSLKVLVLPISYSSLYDFGPENDIEDWRVKYYSIYYGCKFHKFEPKYRLETYYGLHLKRVFYSMLGKVDHRTCNELGFGTTYKQENRPEDWKESGATAAKRHTRGKIDSTIMEKNIRLVGEMVDKCVEKKAQVIILTTPTFHTYRENLNREQLKLMEDCCNSFVVQYDNVCYLNLLADERFCEDDFFDADHLNEFGAAKLTKILQQTIDTLGVLQN